MRSRVSFLLAMLLLAAGAACAPKATELIPTFPVELEVATPTPPPTQPEPPTYTPPPTYTEVPITPSGTFTETLTPADTPTPSITPTGTPVPPTATVHVTAVPTPVKPLNSSGPWLLMSFGDALWAMNPDGTGLTQLAAQKNGFSNYAVAPHGGRIAYETFPNKPELMGEEPPQLGLFNLPAADLVPLTPLHSGTLLGVDANGQELDDDVFAALANNQSLAWSPDGALLAFTGAQGGPSADLYIYSTQGRNILRLTSGATQSLHPTWSPDGKHILSFSAISMNYERSGIGAVINKSWVVRPDGSDLRVVRTYSGGNLEGVNFVGWLNGSAYLEDSGSLVCGWEDLAYVSITSSTYYRPINGTFYTAALDPASGEVLAMIGPPRLPGMGCRSPSFMGLYLVSAYGSHPPKKVDYEPFAAEGEEVIVDGWFPSAHAFAVNIGTKVLLVNQSGKLQLLDVPSANGDFAPDVQPSPDGKLWVVYGMKGLWIASPGQAAREVKAIFSANTAAAGWSLDGTSLFLVRDRMLYHYSLADDELTGVTQAIPGMDFDIGLTWVMP